MIVAEILLRAQMFPSIYSHARNIVADANFASLTQQNVLELKSKTFLLHGRKCCIRNNVS